MKLHNVAQVSDCHKCNTSARIAVNCRVCRTKICADCATRDEVASQVCDLCEEPEVIGIEETPFLAI